MVRRVETMPTLTLFCTNLQPPAHSRHVFAALWARVNSFGRPFIKLPASLREALIGPHP
jgi:hypothetical protein